MRAAHFSISIVLASASIITGISVLAWIAVGLGFVGAVLNGVRLSRAHRAEFSRLNRSRLVPKLLMRRRGRRLDAGEEQPEAPFPPSAAQFRWERARRSVEDGPTARFAFSLAFDWIRIDLAPSRLLQLPRSRAAPPTD